MKPFALVRGTLQKTSGILFITNFSFSGTRIVAPDKQAYIRYPKNKNAFQVKQGSKTQKINQVPIYLKNSGIFCSRRSKF